MKKRKAERDKYKEFETVKYSDRERDLAISAMKSFANDDLAVFFAEVCVFKTIFTGFCQPSRWQLI